MNESMIIERLHSVLEQAAGIWSSGGWAMWGIAIISLVMFTMGMHVYSRLRQTGFRSVPERVWREWIDRPAERRGPIGEILDFVTDATSDKGVDERFEQLHVSETAPYEGDLRVMKVCVSAAPLVGLLGTVTGMLATFGALASGSGGEKTMGLVARGISEALITTETGLVIALPGLFFQYQLARKCEQYKAFLAHLQTACTQSLHRRAREARWRLVRRAAALQITAKLRDRLREEHVDRERSLRPHAKSRDVHENAMTRAIQLAQEGYPEMAERSSGRNH